MIPASPPVAGGEAGVLRRAPFSTDRPLRSENPRLLFLAQTLPFPLDSGVAIRTNNVLRLLSRHFDVEGLFFWRRAAVATGMGVDERLRALSRSCRPQVFEIPQEHSRPRWVADHLRSVATARPYTHFAYTSREFERALTNRLAGPSFDVIHVDSLDLCRYLPLLGLERTVCTHHNVESDLLERRAERVDPLRAAYLRHQARLVRSEERRWVPRVALNVAVSEADADRLREIASGGSYAVVPNAVDTVVKRPLQGADAYVAFLGGTNWFPNRDALEHYAQDIHPLVRRLRPHTRVRWIGKCSPEEQRRFARAGIELTGWLPSIEPSLRDAACTIVPLRVGGGTRLKILDSWAFGKAVVSTSRGCEGIRATDGADILVRDDPETFAEALVRVLEDATLRDRLARGGRATVERHYSWTALEGGMIERYRSVADRAASPRGAG